MLKKRDIFRKCFSNFEVKAVAGLGEEEIDQILQTEGMIKSRRKIDAIINNAKCFLAVVEEFGSFDQYIWSFSNHQILVYKKHQEGQLEASNELSDRLSKDLKKRGFKFLGSITVFSHLQACGIINDHEPECWMYEVVNSKGEVKYME